MTQARSGDAPARGGGSVPSNIVMREAGSALAATGINSERRALTRTDDWRPTKLNPGLFPDGQGGQPPATVPNIAFMLQQYGVTARYNVIKKKVEITIPGMSLTADNADNVAMTHLVSLAALNGINTGLVPASVEAIADRNAYNPVENWIRSRPWDGQDRLQAFYDTLVVREGYPQELKRTLLRKWLLSGVAAALVRNGFKCRGVLTLQGAQGIGKTSWASASFPTRCSRTR